MRTIWSEISVQQIGEKLMFQDEQTLIGAEDFILQLFQFRRDVAFAGGQGLLADEGIRHLSQ